jgi:hypothetical protein
MTRFLSIPILAFLGTFAAIADAQQPSVIAAKWVKFYRLVLMAPLTVTLVANTRALQSLPSVFLSLRAHGSTAIIMMRLVIVSRAYSVLCAPNFRYFMVHVLIEQPVVKWGPHRRKSLLSPGRRHHMLEEKDQYKGSDEATRRGSSRSPSRFSS